MKLKLSYDVETEIPTGYDELYTEKEGKWVLTGIDGMRSQRDIDKLTGALTKEKDDHKKLRTKFAPLMEGAYDVTDVMEKLDKHEELVAQAAGNHSADVDKLVDAKIKTITAPIERERDQLKQSNGELEQEIVGFKSSERTRTISDAVRKASVESKILPSAHDDVIMLAERVFDIGEDGSILTKDNAGVTPGADPAMWLGEMLEKRPHWWPASKGNGAPGSTNTPGVKHNPWGKDHWNLTEQGAVIKSQGIEKATRLAEGAGSKIGATAPPA